MPTDATPLPLVSVIIPVYNGERFLAEAIESVLAQTYQNYEVIVVDDGSTDNSPEIARSYPSVRFIKQEHAGTAAARNRGVMLAAGEYLAFLDADDLWMPNKLRLQMEEFDADPSLAIVTGLVEQFLMPGLEGRFSIPASPQEGYSAVALVIKRAVLERTGGFIEATASAETIAWFVRLAELNLPVRVLPHVVARRRIHGDNTTLLKREEKTHIMLQVLKRAIDRRRAPDERST